MKHLWLFSAMVIFINLNGFCNDEELENKTDPTQEKYIEDENDKNEVEEDEDDIKPINNEEEEENEEE